MSDKKKMPTICEPYFFTNNCSNGEKCILKHIRKEIEIPSPNSAHTDKGRTFSALPFPDLKQEIISKPPPISCNSKLSSNSNSNNSKSLNTIKSKTVNTKQNNLNNFNEEEFPSLSKSQKKRNRRKGKSNTNEPNKEKGPDRMNDRNLCSKPKSACSNKCKSLHGDICDLCSSPVLHPLNAQFRREHSQQCVQAHEEKMKEELATCRSVDKQCGICFEPVMQKKGDRRFAVLPDCNHCFCLVCIKIWRKSAAFGKSIKKSCPECRVVSHYVCPSTYWVETKEDKAELLLKYKAALAKLDCKYFAKNEKCTFGNKCFYKHCKPDGTPVNLGPPRKNRLHNLRHQRDLMMDALFDIIMNDSDDDQLSDDFDHDYSYDFDVVDSDEDDDEDYTGIFT